jgi:UTP--glucose-1-phosphate uridylyltransferase
MKVTTAVIFASGFGSRMLPETASVQKDMLPILDRPIVDYVVSDCLAAGITNFIFTIRPNSHALQDYYTGNSALQAHLTRFGKAKALAELERIHNQATYTYVEQPPEYGTAVPLQAAAGHLPPDEAFIVSGGDDFLWRTDGGSDMKALVETFTQSRADGALMTLECPQEDLHKYGVLEIEGRDGYQYLRRFVEKPDPGEAPSNLINISKYIMTPTMLDYVMAVKPDPKSGELYITDAVHDAAQDHALVVQTAKGQYLDGGSVATWLEANLTVAASRPELADRLRVYNQQHLL